MKETEDMSGAFEADRSDYYYLEKVPYTLYFDKARAIHGAYWRTSLGYEQSHGCVNMSIGDAAWVFAGPAKAIGFMSTTAAGIHQRTLRFMATAAHRAGVNPALLPPNFSFVPHKPGFDA
jgi:hypothetical protein